MVEVPQDEGQAPASTGSLEDRIREAAAASDLATSAKFPLPGRFHDHLAVELRVVGYMAAAKLARRHERTDELMRPLYIMADEMLAATVAFWAITESGAYERSDGSTWQSLARAANPMLPDDASPRIALLDLCGDDGAGAMLLARDYTEWVRAGRSGRDREVMEDFASTR